MVGEITPTWYELALLILGAVLITAAVGWMAVALFVASWKRPPPKGGMMTGWALVLIIIGCLLVGFLVGTIWTRFVFLD